MPVSYDLQRIKPNDDVELLNIVWDYLHKASNYEIAGRLRQQCEEHRIGCKARYEVIGRRWSIEGYDYLECVKSILDSLLIPEEEQEKYLEARNLYDLMKLLQPKHRHFSHLIKMIDETNPPNYWAKTFLATAGLTAGISTLFYFKPVYFDRCIQWVDKIIPLEAHIFRRTFSVARNVPLLGWLVHGLMLFWAWYKAFSDGLYLDHDQISELFTKTIQNTFPIIGYTLCFLASAVMTPAAMAFFIIGSGIDAISSAYCFVKHEVDRLLSPAISEETYYGRLQAARIRVLRERDLWAMSVKCLFTLMIAASVTIWCVFPPSVLIIATCIVFEWLIGLSRGSFERLIDEHYAHLMQKELNAITQEAIRSGEYKPLPKQSIDVHPKEVAVETDKPLRTGYTTGIRFLQGLSNARKNSTTDSAQLQEFSSMSTTM